MIAAAHLGHDEIVEVTPRHQRTASRLVRAGARRDLGDRNGMTPIELARQRGYDAMVRILARKE